MQGICPDATCFPVKPYNRLWDLQTLFDHRVFAASALDHVASGWSTGKLLLLEPFPGLGLIPIEDPWAAT